MGLVLGTAVGFIGGGYLAFELADDYDTAMGLWSLFIAGGGFGGYALAGGFNGRMDDALEQGRMRVRRSSGPASSPPSAQRQPPQLRLPDRPYPELDLRLSYVPGLEMIDISSDERPVRLAGLGTPN